MISKTDGDLLSAGGVALASGVPQLTLRRWTRDGLIPYHRDSAGRRYYTHEAVVEAKKLRERKSYFLPKAKEPETA
jgi:DNA-binding transcriptional MerR regulator